MAIHFEGKFKGKYQTVPFCTRWGLSPRWGAMTTDKSKVTCSRCAKQLGIEAAPVVKSGSPAGTCQCCFGNFKMPHGKGRVSLHGYQRPGHGYIIGRCRGEGHVPYEVSCEQTKVFRDELGVAQAVREQRVDDLKNNGVPVLLVKVKTGKREEPRPGERRGQEIYKTVEVKLGQVRSPNPFLPDSYYEEVPAYDELRNRQVAELEGEIKAIKRNIAFLTEKIETWKPVAAPSQVA